jgi:general stress protein 26
MLTTRDAHDNLGSRPMALQEDETDSDLWFVEPAR